VSSRRSSYLERRRARLDTSDTSVERQKPVKKKGMFQRAKNLMVPRETSDEVRTSSEEEILTLVPVQLQQNSAVPRQGTAQSAAWDLQSPVDCLLPGRAVTRINLKLRIALPTGYYTQLVSRSSLASKGIVVIAGVIDADFRGDICVLLHNLTEKAFLIRAGDKVAGAIFLQYAEPVFQGVESLPSSDRGAGGFGSTGK
jgi:dUTP pyrophosphatase